MSLLSRLVLTYLLLSQDGKKRKLGGKGPMAKKKQHKEKTPEPEEPKGKPVLYISGLYCCCCYLLTYTKLATVISNVMYG